jgi:hypothetical protein
MPTKDSELIDTLDVELREVDGALIQIRQLTKRLESARDTLRYVRNVIYGRSTQETCRDRVREFTDRKGGESAS